MNKPTITSYIRENLGDLDEKNDPGPYLTISRQYGCDGYALGDLLLKKLDERAGEGVWSLYKKEILKQLAEDTGLTEDVIERERLTKPSILRDFFRGMRGSTIPDGFEIRRKITVMVRTAAFEGHAIIIGQGGTAAASDLKNGLSVRLEGPLEWRIARVSARENLSRQAAISRIEEIEKQRKHLRKIYEETNPREPAFNLLIDNSMMNIDQLVELILFTMERKNLID